MIKRTKCVLSDKPNIEEIYSYRNFPIKMGCDAEPNKLNDIYEDMNWGISSEGIVQLLDLVPQEILYSNYHNSGSVGSIWRNHHLNFANFIKENDYKNVLEIGGSNGSLVNNFLREQKEFSWDILEPSCAKTFSDKRVNVVKGFFETHEFDKSYDTIIHSHVLEHIYEPLQFLKKIWELLQFDGNHFISIPNMRHWLSCGYTNTLMFEHTYYIDDLVLENLLSKCGFKVDRMHQNEHSIFVRASRKDKTEKKEYDFSYIKKMFDSYVFSLASDVKEICNKVGNENVFIFGAHIFSQFILNLGLDEDSVVYVLDNDTTKHGKRLYGTDLLVESPEILKEYDSPKVVLRGGIYTEEIKQSIVAINSKTVFY